MGFAIVIGMLVLSIAAPFVALYAVSKIKKGDLKGHAKIQKTLFYVCVLGVLALEGLIRVSGGSGSLVANSVYSSTTWFKTLLICHIIGAVLTYIVWGYSIFKSGAQNKKSNLPGSFSPTHRKLGYFIIIGLFYTGITAFFVCLFAFFL
jgi:uncharacterized membrane protein YozB (DUF420 family)